ncbi:MAG TPA: hypothetical protein VGI39_42740 [Polyangiaceae bacterium]|jgi:hypothetical protein
MRTAPFFAVPLVVFLSACSAGRYGHSPTYAPLSGENEAVAGARDYDPVMYARQPEEWRQGTVSLFGVVTNRGTGPGGGAYLTLSVRHLETRNLCENHNDEDTCRVTVSDKDFGSVHALVKLTGEDDVGEHSVSAGSLLRLVGKFGENVDPNDGGPILHATWYRHWPRYFYVTSAARGLMRQ